jgi:hypothetical protein
MREAAIFRQLRAPIDRLGMSFAQRLADLRVYQWYEQLRARWRT